MTSSARPTIKTVPATAPIEDILSILHEDGVIVLSDFVRFPDRCSGILISQATEAEVDALNKQAIPHFEKQEAEGMSEHKIKGFRASNTTVFYDLLGEIPQDTSKLYVSLLWAEGRADSSDCSERSGTKVRRELCFGR
jgi:hypothetical protein